MSRLLVSFDPGLRVAGVAIFDLDSESLVAAGLARSTEKTERGAVAWHAMARAACIWVAERSVGGLISHAVTEYPQVYKASKSKGDPNDLIEITGAAASFLGRLNAPNQRTVLPREWKGNLNPEVMIKRIQDRVTVTERARIELPAESLAHNVWDAVGIGLHVLGRLAPRKVYPR